MGFIYLIGEVDNRNTFKIGVTKKEKKNYKQVILTNFILIDTLKQSIHINLKKCYIGIFIIKN